MTRKILKHLRNMMFAVPLVFAIAVIMPGEVQKAYAEGVEETHECSWDEGQITKDANCFETGIITYTCTDPECNNTTTEDIPITHSYGEATIKKATTKADGSEYRVCTVEGCEAKETLRVIPKIKSQKLSYDKVVYNGSAKKPSVIILDSNNNPLEKDYYSVSYESGRTKVGRYKVTITYEGDYSGSTPLYFTIVPKKPTSPKVSLNNLTKVGGHDDVTVSWTASASQKSTGTIGYLVYYKKSTASKWSGPKATTKTSYLFDNELADGIAYKFKIVPYYRESGKTTKYYDENQFVETKTITTKKPGRIITKNYQKYYEYYQGSYSAGKYAKSKFITLSGKTYRFDSKGKMVTGWAKISSKYYYFNRSTGVQVKSGTVDGIKISSGKASATTLNKNKMDLMITARKKMQAITKPTDTKAQKLRKVFDWVLKHPYERYRKLHEAKQKKGWEVTFANDIFKKGDGCCVSEACALAFLAKECGYTDVCIVDDGGHAWAEINGRVYDTLFAATPSKGGYSKYYNSTRKKVGVDKWKLNEKSI